MSAPEEEEDLLLLCWPLLRRFSVLRLSGFFWCMYDNYLHPVGLRPLAGDA